MDSTQQDKTNCIIIVAARATLPPEAAPRPRPAWPASIRRAAALAVAAPASTTEAAGAAERTFARHRQRVAARCESAPACPSARRQCPRATRALPATCLRACARGRPQCRHCRWAPRQRRKTTWRCPRAPRVRCGRCGGCNPVSAPVRRQSCVQARRAPHVPRRCWARRS